MKSARSWPLTRRQFLSAGASGALLLRTGEALHASEPLRVGMSAAFSGPLSYLGRSMRDGLLLGLEGSGIDLVAYDKVIAKENAKSLISNRVAAMLGCVGTPTALSVRQVTGELPFIGAHTGTSELRTSAQTSVFNLRASYEEELNEWVACFRYWKIPRNRIALVTQSEPGLVKRDRFGTAVLEGFSKAMGYHSGVGEI